jgi:hypothetical protein
MEGVAEILYKAAAAPHGLVLKVSDYSLALSRLRSAKKEAADEFLDCLSFHRSPYMPEEELWIVKKGSAICVSTGETNE